MKRLTFRTVFYLALDAFLLGVCLLHIPYVVRRPSAPFEAVKNDTQVAVARIIDQSACASVQAGDILVSWGGRPVVMPEEVEYLADVSPIGTQIRVEISRGNQTFSTSIQLIPYYESFRFLIISLFVGLTVFGVGVFILLSRPKDVAARGLHWSLITLGTTIMATWGLAEPGLVETYLARIVWFVTYLGVAVSFFFFTFVFPKERLPRLGQFSWLLLIAVMALGTAFAFSHLTALSSGSPEAFRTFQTFFDLFHVSLFVFVGGGILNIARATFKASTDEERRKMYWVLWGLAIGTLPYLVLHILPQIILSKYLIPEEFTTIFFLAVPIGFAIAILKYRLLDIEVVINRTIVYGVLSFFIIVAYALVVLLVTSIIGEEIVFEHYLMVAGLTLLIGLLINPLRLRLQHVVDEVLFAARANYRRALSGAVGKLHQALNRDDLYRQLVVAVHSVVPGEVVAAYGVQNSDLSLRAFEGLEPQANIMLAEGLKRTLVAGRILIKGKIAHADELSVDSSREEWLSSCHWTVCVPLVSEVKELLGVLVLNPRLAREHYEEEEINFLMNVGAQASQILERLTLQEKIILAQEEQRRSEELSALKSYFISSVSHELRTPLTSIRMFAEMLRSRAVPSPRRQREYLAIIEGESERLSRLIGNILDFAKIERGVKEYSFATVRIEEVAERAVQAMRYQFLQHGAKLRTHVEKNLPTLEADKDALEEAFLNLLSNALKYSTTRKEVDLRVTGRKRKIEIVVADKGIGIQESEIPLIFDRFYRVRDVRSRQVGGAGLGLALVKHIVDAHLGTISVQSTVGKGTTFVIELPISRQRRRKKE